MTKVNKIQVVMTQDETAELIREAASQQRTISNLARKYINEGIKKDRPQKSIPAITEVIEKVSAQPFSNRVLPVVDRPIDNEFKK